MAEDAAEVGKDGVRAATLAISDTLTWNTIVGKQYVRVLEAGFFDRQMELYLFVVALRGVVRGAEFARRVSKAFGMTGARKRISQALKDFQAFLPDATKVRNIIEHFDDYRMGTGDLQKARKMGNELLEWVEESGGEITLVLGGQYQVETMKAKAAADHLANEVAEALRIV